MAKNDTAIAAPEFVVKRRVVVPTMKVDNTPIFVRFEQPIEVRKKLEDDGKGGKEEKTIEIGRVTNLQGGEVVEFVIGTVLHSELHDAYPNDGYVGKCFRIQKKDVPGKRYKTYELDEIEVTAPKAGK